MWSSSVLATPEPVVQNEEEQNRLGSCWAEHMQKVGLLSGFALGLPLLLLQVHSLTGTQRAAIS